VAENPVQAEEVLRRSRIFAIVTQLSYILSDIARLYGLAERLMKNVRSRNRAAARAMRGYVAGFGLLFALTLSASAETLHVAGAGSLTAAFTNLLRSFPAAPDTSRRRNSALRA
jgi:hypothetical protein